MARSRPRGIGQNGSTVSTASQSHPATRTPKTNQKRKGQVGIRNVARMRPQGRIPTTHLQKSFLQRYSRGTSMVPKRIDKRKRTKRQKSTHMGSQLGTKRIRRRSHLRIPMETLRCGVQGEGSRLHGERSRSNNQLD